MQTGDELARRVHKTLDGYLALGNEILDEQLARFVRNQAAPRLRHRGVATALIRHCVDDARARGAVEVVIASRLDDTPKRMYAAMGFRPFCVSRTYLKT